MIFSHKLNLSFSTPCLNVFFVVIPKCINVASWNSSIFSDIGLSLFLTNQNLNQFHKSFMSFSPEVAFQEIFIRIIFGLLWKKPSVNPFVIENCPFMLCRDQFVLLQISFAHLIWVEYIHICIWMRYCAVSHNVSIRTLPVFLFNIQELLAFLNFSFSSEYSQTLNPYYYLRKMTLSSEAPIIIRPMLRPMQFRAQW